MTTYSDHQQRQLDQQSSRSIDRIQSQPAIARGETNIWQPISTAPIDEWVILATTGDWVGQAAYGEDKENPKWRWAESDDVHPDHTPLGWMPLPPPLSEPAK